MLRKNLILFPALFFILLQSLSAQNINGLEIPVSKDAMTSLEFHSEVTGYYFVEKGSPFQISTLDLTSIMLHSNDAVDKVYHLVLEEGGRKHKFTVVYKENLDISQQDWDFSDLKQLDKQVKEINNHPATTATPVQPNQPSPNAIPANNQPPVNNNTTANTQPVTTAVSNDNSKDANNFYVLLQAADDAKKAGQYDVAKTKYEQALQVQPDNTYAKSGLDEVKKSIADQSRLKHDELMTKANNAFLADKNDEALKYYNDILSFAPDDAYAKSQAQLIQKKLETAKIEDAARQKDTLFNSYINTGDKAYLNKSYDEAIIAYNEALKTKPGDTFATSKINTVKQKRFDDSVAADKNAKDALYTSYINSGNKALQQKSYDEANLAFNEALKSKPGDAIAIAKLNSISQQIVADSLQAGRNKAIALHDNYIKSANEALKQNLYDVAKNNLNEALKIEPEDADAKKQLKAIDDALNKIKMQQQKDLEAQKNLEQKAILTNIINAADSLYNSGMYTEAKDKYLQAVAINKNDSYSINKILQINNILSQRREKFKADSINSLKYSAIIIKADKDFDNKDYTTAKLSYQNALKIKPNDQYAKDKLGQIDAALLAIAARGQAVKDSIAKDNETTKQYNALVTKAKAAYTKNDYVMARGFYASANNLKPGEDEPKNKMAEIDSTLSKIAFQAQQRAISDSLSDAGALGLATSDYASALHNFSESLNYNPDPDNISYIKKQIAFAQKQIALKDSLNNIATASVEQHKNIDSVMAFYTNGKNALKLIDYQTALVSFKQFVNAIDTLGISSSQFNIESLERFSREKITAIQDYLARQKNLPKDTAARRLPDVKNLGTVTVITYYNPKDPKLDVVYKKYPDLDFNRPPDNQLFDSVSDYSVENKLISKDVMTAKPQVLAEKSENGITLTCQNIIFKEQKVYLKLLLQNTDKEEFLTGAMLLKLKKQDGTTTRILPNYVAGYPIILTNNQKVIVYVTKVSEISDDDNLQFEVTDRLNTSKISIIIPGNAFNQERKNIHQ